MHERGNVQGVAAPGRGRGGALGTFVVIELVALVVYGPTLRNYFVSEDLMSAASWSWNDVLVELTSPGLEQGFRPLMVGMWAALNALFGRDPLGPRLVYVLLHGVNGMLFLGLALRMHLDRLAAWLAALLFLVHPVQAEALNWLSAAAGSVPTASLMLASVLLHLRWLDLPPTRGRGACRAASLVSFVLALLVKEYAVALPLLLTFLDWDRCRAEGRARDGRGLASAARRVAAFWTILVAYAAYRTVVLRGVGNFGTASPIGGPAAMLANLVTHARALALPWSDGPPLALAFDGMARVPLVLAAIGAVALLIGGSLRWSLLWMAVLLLPAVNRAGHYHLYLSVAGLGALGGGVLVQASRLVPPVAGRVLRLAAPVLILSFSVRATWVANTAWSEASSITRRVPREVRQLHPRPQPGTYFLFLGLPDNVRGAYAFRWGIQPAIRMEYGDRTLRAYNVRDVRRFSGESTRHIIEKTEGMPRFLLCYEAGHVRDLAPEELRDLLAEEVLVEQPRAERRTGEIAGRDVQGQTFRVGALWVTRVDLRLDPPPRPDHPVTFRLKRAVGARDDLAKVELAPSDLLAGDWNAVRFPKVGVPPDGALYFQVESPGAVRGGAFALLQAAGDAYAGGTAFRNGAPQGHDLVFRVTGLR